MILEKNNSKLQYFGRDLEAMSFAKNYHDWIIDEFKPYLGENSAEVGAGIGSFSQLLLPMIKHLTAFEPSENMYPALAEEFATNEKVDTINDYFGNRVNHYEEAFDSVVYVNVMEHIEHDKDEFGYAYRSLKPGGHLLVFVPATPFLYSPLDKSLGHFRRYVRSELIDKSTGAGFHTVKCHYFDVVGILPWLIVFKLMKKEISGGKVSAYDNMVVPFMRRLESLVRPPIGKNLLLVAKKL